MPVPPPINVHVDYLVGTFHLGENQSQTELLKRIELLTGERVEPDRARPIYRGQYWQASGTSPNGMVVARQDETRDAPAKIWLSIPGKVCSQQTPENQLWTLRYFALHAASITRLDIAADLEWDDTTMTNLDEAIDATNILGARSWKKEESGTFGGDSGWTRYFGAAGADKRLCVYDKRAESKGVIDAIRWELRLLDDRARYAARYLYQECGNNAGMLASQLAGMVAGCIDFRKREGAKKITRCDRLAWWQDIVDSLGKPCQPIIQRAVASIHRAISWVRRQVWPTIKLLQGAMDESYWEGLVSHWENTCNKNVTRDKIATMDRWKREIQELLANTQELAAA
jgi:hypothetical protein